MSYSQRLTKTCAGCNLKSPNASKDCQHCGAPFYLSKRLSMTEAIRTVMTAAVIAHGLGYRPDKLVAAWEVCFRKAYGHHPRQQDYLTAGLPYGNDLQ